MSRFAWLQGRFLLEHVLPEMSATHRVAKKFLTAFTTCLEHPLTKICWDKFEDFIEIMKVFFCQFDSRQSLCHFVTSASTDDNLLSAWNSLIETILEKKNSPLIGPSFLSRPPPGLASPANASGEDNGLRLELRFLFHAFILQCVRVANDNWEFGERVHQMTADSSLSAALAKLHSEQLPCELQPQLCYYVGWLLRRIHDDCDYCSDIPSHTKAAIRTLVMQCGSERPADSGSSRSRPLFYAKPHMAMTIFALDSSIQHLMSVEYLGTFSRSSITCLVDMLQLSEDLQTFFFAAISNGSVTLSIGKSDVSFLLFLKLYIIHYLDSSQSLLVKQYQLQPATSIAFRASLFKNLEFSK